MNSPYVPCVGSIGAATIISTKIDNGSTSTKIIIDPSKKGAASGVLAGAIVGSVLGPVGTVAGALVGGTVGFIFGPED